MIDPLVVDSLIGFLNTILTDYTVEDETGKLWSMTVMKGFLPPKRTETAENYEKFCILVRYDEGEADFITAENQSKSINRIKIAVRTVSSDVVLGPQNTINVMAMIQREIYAHPIIGKRYKATFPLKWTAPGGQTWPFWEGEMTIPFIVPMVQEIFDMGLGIGGDYRG